MELNNLREIDSDGYLNCENLIIRLENNGYTELRSTMYCARYIRYYSHRWILVYVYPNSVSIYRGYN